MDTSRRERRVLHCALALYILYESSSTLMRHVAPDRSIVGIVIASASVIVMPLLAPDVVQRRSHRSKENELDTA